nr:hypothetical protein [Methanoculleus bourgensis]
MVAPVEESLVEEPEPVRQRLLRLGMEGLDNGAAVDEFVGDRGEEAVPAAVNTDDVRPVVPQSGERPHRKDSLASRDADLVGIAPLPEYDPHIGSARSQFPDQVLQVDSDAAALALFPVVGDERDLHATGVDEWRVAISNFAHPGKVCRTDTSRTALFYHSRPLAARLFPNIDSSDTRATILTPRAC